MDRCLHFLFVYLITEVILASSKCRKKANQNSGILPSSTADQPVESGYGCKKNIIFSNGFSSKL